MVRFLIQLITITKTRLKSPNLNELTKSTQQHSETTFDFQPIHCTNRKSAIKRLRQTAYIYLSHSKQLKSTYEHASTGLDIVKHS